MTKPDDDDDDACTGICAACYARILLAQMDALSTKLTAQFAEAPPSERPVFASAVLTVKTVRELATSLLEQVSGTESAPPPTLPTPPIMN